jgi:hypothetical protein
MNVFERRLHDASMGNLIETVKWVHGVFEGRVTFCGSFGLILNGLISRPIKDLDIITDDNYYGQPNLLNDEVRASFLGRPDTLDTGVHEWGNSGEQAGSIYTDIYMVLNDLKDASEKIVQLNEAYDAIVSMTDKTVIVGCQKFTFEKIRELYHVAFHGSEPVLVIRSKKKMDDLTDGD